MAVTTCPRLVRHSPTAIVAVVLLTFLVAIVEVPHAASPTLAPAPAFAA